MSKITGKDRRPSSLVYNAYVESYFYNVAPNPNSTESTVQSRVPLALNSKVIALVVCAYNGPTGSLALNIVAGPGAVGSLATQRTQGTVAGQFPEDIQATVGQKMFATGQPVTMTDEAVTVIYNSANPDVVWPAGTELTLRATTDDGFNAVLDVRLITTPVDQNPMSPEEHAQPFTISVTTI